MAQFTTNDIRHTVNTLLQQPTVSIFVPGWKPNNWWRCLWT